MNEEIHHIIVTDTSIGIYWIDGPETLYVKANGYDICVHHSGMVEISQMGFDEKPILIASVHKMSYIKFSEK